METELCKIAYKWTTDKCPKIRHYYTPIYYEMFKDRRDKIRKVLEIGIGYPRVMGHVEKKTKKKYITGASLFMWREFFPNAQVFGADHTKSAMVKGEDRITTFVCDEHNKNDLEKLVEKTGSDIDIFIDDGAHDHTSQIFLAVNILPLLSKDVVYVIEDIFSPKRVTRELDKYGYQCEVPKLLFERYRENLIIVKNK